MRVSSSSVRFLTRTVLSTLALARILAAYLGPMPYTYVKATPTCFCSGMVTPAILAIMRSPFGRLQVTRHKFQGSRMKPLLLLGTCYLLLEMMQSFALSLPLLMLRLKFVDNANAPLTTHNNVVGADFLDARTYFHPVRNPFSMGIPFVFH